MYTNIFFSKTALLIFGEININNKYCPTFTSMYLDCELIFLNSCRNRQNNILFILFNHCHFLLALTSVIACFLLMFWPKLRRFFSEAYCRLTDEEEVENVFQDRYHTRNLGICSSWSKRYFFCTKSLPYCFRSFVNATFLHLRFGRFQIRRYSQTCANDHLRTTTTSQQRPL